MPTAAQRMRRLIESLLELARLDAGQERMKQTRFNLSELVRGRVEEIRPLAGERGSTFMRPGRVQCMEILNGWNR